MKSSRSAALGWAQAHPDRNAVVWVRDGHPHGRAMYFVAGGTAVVEKFTHRGDLLLTNGACQACGLVVLAPILDALRPQCPACQASDAPRQYQLYEAATVIELDIREDVRPGELEEEERYE